ncbi:unnamed protein product [Alopecurus aequalis]
MSVVVTKSSPVLVRPSSDPADSSSHIKLSSVDECYASLPVTCLLVFDHPIDDPVVTIKHALSQALVHYSAIAGRLADDNRILCTGEGVMFVGASASRALVPTLPPINDLALRYPGELCRHGEPLLLMQVTEFSCGGFTIAVTWNHGVADAKGMAQFLQDVGELARGMPAPSVLPVRTSEKLPVIPPWMLAVHRSSMQFVGVASELAVLDFTVPWTLIRRIKALHGCTVYEAVTAVLWRCRTRAIITDPEAAATLSFPCNTRKHLGTEDGYYGNCIVVAFVHATAGSVAKGTIGDLVDLIKSAKETVRHGDNVLLMGTTSNGDQESGPTVDQIKKIMYNVTTVTNWRNLGFDGADFGHGTPSRVMWHMEHVTGTNCFACPPCKGVDGVNIMSRCVWPQHVQAFLAELQHVDA